ncbi:hypothetical protein OG976_00800 [Mycobacterium sp. NBC_00419]|uniref:hypothetical protein n=1 Tax=Mycobacterium sp. NBC_00419 TaxID=2975989 RepID=UPI002E21737B
MRKFMVAAAITGFLTAPLSLAGPASAACDSASCLPNVARNVTAGAPCTPSINFVFGLDPAGNTLICSTAGKFVPTGPLQGEAAPAIRCSIPGATAQTRLSGNTLQVQVPGIPLQCVGQPGATKWVHFDVPAW